ncbi:MAG TPA: hypothetical protein VJ804_01040 [Acidimicrobiales bacterium]|nr:hypothetical protein [Acidimicrobiales bacterium]
MTATAPLLFSTTELHLVHDATADERYDSLRRPCPACGLPGLRIVYGEPSAALVDAARRGKVILGGCTHRTATHRCPYGYEWHAADASW